jgi:DNA-binding transcriptional LysR family regulator
MAIIRYSERYRLMLSGTSRSDLTNPAMDKAKTSWRISYTSPSLAGTIAAVKAGLGITVLPANMLPAGIHPIRALPELSDAEIALMQRDDLSKASEMLAEHIMHSLEQVAA